ncbi:hypothetical protein ABIB82_005684 [Bradyrhizobium sp. i1.8.4]
MSAIPVETIRRDENEIIGLTWILVSSASAKRREDGKFILIPPEKIERSRDNPDGRNHLCAPPPSTLHATDTAFCLAVGGAT